MPGEAGPHFAGLQRNTRDFLFVGTTAQDKTVLHMEAGAGMQNVTFLVVSLER